MVCWHYRKRVVSMSADINWTTATTGSPQTTRAYCLSKLGNQATALEKDTVISGESNTVALDGHCPSGLDIQCAQTFL